MKTYKEMTESIISRSSGIITTKANKRYEIIKGLRLLAFCAVVVVLIVALTSHKNSASKSSTPETSTEKRGGIMISGTQRTLTEEEVFSAGTILKGTFTGVELIVEKMSMLYNVYGIEVSEYLCDETEGYAEKIYITLAASAEIPSKLKVGEEYIFMMYSHGTKYNNGPIEGEYIFNFLSFGQGIFTENEDGKYTSSWGIGKSGLSYEEIKALVEKYHSVSTATMEEVWPEHLLHGWSQYHFDGFELGVLEGTNYPTLTKGDLKIIVKGDVSTGIERDIEIINGDKSLTISSNYYWGDCVHDGDYANIFFADVTGDGNDELIFADDWFTEHACGGDYMVINLDTMQEIELSDSIFKDIADKFTVELKGVNGTTIEYSITDSEGRVYNLSSESYKECTDIDEVNLRMPGDTQYIYEDGGVIYVMFDIGFMTEMYCCDDYIIATLEYSDNKLLFNGQYEICENMEIDYDIFKEDVAKYEKAREEYLAYQQEKVN